MTGLLSTPTLPAPAAVADDAERIARRRRLRTSIIRHRQALYDWVWAGFRKSATELEITEMQIVLGEIAHTIRHLRRWMRPRRARCCTRAGGAWRHCTTRRTARACAGSPT